MAIPQFDFTDKPTNQLNTAQTTFDFSDPEPAQAQTSMADFRQMDAESMNQPGVARAEAIQNMPDFIKPAFMGLGRLESKIVDPVLNNPWVSRASQTGGEIMTMVDNPDKADTGSGFGNISADLVGSVAGFVANPESAGQKIWNFGEKTLGRALADTVPQAPGMVKEGIKAAGATIPFEATRMIVNDREANPGEMGIAIGANAVLSALIHGLLKPEDVKFSPEGIPLKVNYMGAEVPIIDAQKNYEYLWSNLRTPVKNDFTADQFGNVRSGEKLPELPAGQQPLALPEGNRPLALTGQQPPMLSEGKIPNWDYYQPTRFQSTPDGKIIDMEQGSFPLAKVEGIDYAPNTALNGRQRIAQDIDQTVPRSDIGDPQYLASLEQRYNKMVADEVALLKEGTGSKPTQGNLKFDNEGNVIGRYGRTSNNAEWYQNFWKENGRPPTEGEIRDVAIKNMIEGDRFTGREASDEFHAILSELARGQKLPEEWHGLQKSIRGLENVQKTDVAMADAEGITPLLSDMKAAQKQVEPYGLNKNLDRLTELENQARKRMKDRADFRRQYPDAIGIKAQNPLDELKDLATVGAAKIARGAVTFEKWAIEMVDDFGETIRPKLENLWKMAQEHLQNLWSEPQQAISSADTSINATKTAATFNRVKFEPGTTNLDYGGGRFDNATEMLASKQVKNLIYDPFNRDAKHNQEVINAIRAGNADTVTVNNVLNVIAEPDARIAAIRNASDALKTDGTAYFLIHEGNKTGMSAPSSKGWQNNWKASQYVDEISKYFGNVQRKGNMLVAKNPQNLVNASKEARQRIADRNEAYKSGNMNIVARNPLDDVKDLSIIGASKIAKGVTDFAQWSKEMLAEFGEIIRAKLNDIWEASRAVLTNERGSIRFGGESHVVSKTDREPVNWAGAGEKAYTTVIDDFNRVSKFDDRLDEVHFQSTGKHLAPEDRAYLAGMNSKEAGGTTKTIVTNNLVDRNGNVIGKSLQSTVEQIPKGRFKQMNAYLVLKNAGSWMAKGKHVYPRSMPEFYEPTQKIGANLAKIESVSKSTAYTDQQKAVIIDALQKENDSFMAGINRLLDQGVAEYEQANPIFKKISDELYAFDKAFKEEWLVNSGVISKEAWEAMQAEHPNYVKFQRKLDKAETGGAYQKGAGGQPVKRAKGSERPIINPIESMVEDIDRIVNIARKQEVRQLMYENMAKYPEEMQAFGRIAYEGEIPRAARKAPEEGELRDIIDNKIDELGFDPKHGNTVPVQVNGRTEHIVFYDPALLEALQALDPKASGIVINAAREVSRTMKVLTTGANPIFSSRNFARDLPMAYIFSDTLAKTPIKREMQFAWGIVDSMARVVTGGRYDPGGFYKTYKALGGGSHTSSVASDRNILAETMGAILPNEGKSVLSKVKGAGRGIEAFTNAVETIPRLPEYVRTVQQMGDTAGARKLGLNRAQDLVNFSRRGSMSGEADAVIPYLNASLQAIDKIVRTFKKDPLETTERAFAAITIPAVMLWMINKDNPDYQQLSSWTKDNYYCIPTNDGKFIKIAKPREVGVLFASLPERCLETWANDDPEGFRNFAAAWEANFIPANRPIWAPFTDIAANKSFSGTPIIPGYQEKLSPELQYDESTSIPAKAIGGALGVSPKKIDYITRSYTGVVGQLGLPATAGNGGLGEALSRNLLSDSLYSTDILTNFYNDKAKLDTASADYDATGKPGKNYDPEKLKLYNRATRDISALKEQMRTINASDIDPDQKEFALRGLQEKILNIARQVKSGTYGNGSANWITQWQTRL